jgi:hypothetical protein
MIFKIIPTRRDVEGVTCLLNFDRRRFPYNSNFFHYFSKILYECLHLKKGMSSKSRALIKVPWKTSYKKNPTNPYILCNKSPLQITFHRSHKKIESSIGLPDPWILPWIMKTDLGHYFFKKNHFLKSKSCLKKLCFEAHFFRKGGSNLVTVNRPFASK